MKSLLFLSLLMTFIAAYADSIGLDKCSTTGKNPVWEYVTANPDKITEDKVASRRTKLPGGVLENAVIFGYKDLVYSILRTHSASKLEMGDALSAAASMGRIKMSSILLKNGVSVNSLNVNGTTALYAATQYGCTDEVEFLIKHGIDVNYRNSDISNTPMIDAVVENHYQTAAMLMKYGYKPTQAELDKIHSLLIRKNRISVWSYLFSRLNAANNGSKSQ